MLKVKHFICGATHNAIEYLDQDMNEWMRKNGVTELKQVSEVYGQSPVGMSGHQENVLFVSIWYETPDQIEEAAG